MQDSILRKMLTANLGCICVNADRVSPDTFPYTDTFENIVWKPTSSSLLCRHRNAILLLRQTILLSDKNRGLKIRDTQTSLLSLLLPSYLIFDKPFRTKYLNLAETRPSVSVNWYVH